MLEKLEVKLAQDEREGKALPIEVGRPGWYEAAQVTDAHRHQTRHYTLFSAGATLSGMLFSFAKQEL